jgi:hypothetical protein
MWEDFVNNRGLEGGKARQIYVAQDTKWLRPAVPCLLYLRVLSFDISVIAVRAV